MYGELKTGPAGNRTLTATQSLRSCVMAESHCSTTPTSPSLSRPKTEPARVGILLPGVLAEMRRLQREREAGR